jgi:hypothetical protein
MLGLSPMVRCGTELAIGNGNCPVTSIMSRGYRIMLKRFVFRDVTPCSITNLYSTSALRVEDLPDLIIWAVGSFETSGAVYQSTRDNILEDLNIWQQIYQNPHILPVIWHAVPMPTSNLLGIGPENSSKVSDTNTRRVTLYFGQGTGYVDRGLVGNNAVIYTLCSTTYLTRVTYHDQLNTMGEEAF